MHELTVTLPSKKRIQTSYGTRVYELIKQEDELKQSDFPFVAAMVNNELVSLSFKIEINSNLNLVTLDMPQGIRIYRNSLIFLLAYAAQTLYPDVRLCIGHSLGDGYFCYLENAEGIEDDYVRQIEHKMFDIAAEDLPIVRKVMSYTEIVNHYHKRNEKTRVLRLRYRNEQKIPVYSCNDYIELGYQPLAPSTGFLTDFGLLPYENGFILQYPPSSNPLSLGKFEKNPILFSIYQEYKSWGKILGVTCVGQLNELTHKGDIENFIQVAEALHDKKIASIADSIHHRKGEVKVVLIAGPSSSGKTTFTKKLAIQLKVLGFNPVMISLDDYFVPREQTPRAADGSYDFEDLQAIDIELLNSHLVSLFSGKEIELPLFDFKTGTRKKSGCVLRLEDRNILLMEGIHGLNDQLTPLVPHHQKFKIYISALTQLNLDSQTRIPTTDNRLIRRMVRDFQFRGHSALDTLKMWSNVRRGEERNIFPFQNNADAAFNSALDYELAILKHYAEPILKTVKPYHEEYAEAIRLADFLSNFMGIPERHIPRMSILREFIGESGFKY
ncbi:MAG: nucleoside kinase [Spirochaetales bacterium]|nr:nucleoside kinase [Spirochaetales bacterium]